MRLGLGRKQIYSSLVQVEKWIEQILQIFCSFIYKTEISHSVIYEKLKIFLVKNTACCTLDCHST